MIAPHISETIDGRNILKYSFGERIVFPQESLKFSFNRSDYKPIHKTLFLPLHSAFDIGTVFNLLVVSDKETQFSFSLFSNGKVVTTASYTVSESPLLIRLNPVLGPGLNSLDFEFGDFNDSTLNVELSAQLQLLANKKVLTSADFNSDHFFVERLELPSKAIVCFDSFGNIFNNPGLDEKIIVFSKPVAVRNLNFVSGNSSAVIYYFSRVD